VDDGVYVQDIVLMPKTSSSSDPSLPPSLPVIVEVDGPPHFFNNMPRRSRGDHKLKVGREGRRKGRGVEEKYECTSTRRETQLSFSPSFPPSLPP
jgi:hypothetical protein